MNYRGLFVAILFICSGALFAQESPSERCGRLNYSSDSRPVQYCIFQDRRSTNKDVIWLFQAFIGGEREWTLKKRWKLLRLTLNKANYQMPTVITVSWGQFFLMVPENSASKSGLYDLFVNDAMPALESMVPGFSGKRIGIGASMGGFNLAQVAFRNPSLFQKLVFVSPLVESIAPWRGNITKYTNENKASYLKTSLLQSELKYYYKTDEDFFEDVLLNIIPQNNNVAVPVYLSTTAEDDYGFRPSHKKFNDKLLDAGFNVEFHDLKTASEMSISGKVNKYPAEHAMIDEVSLSQFLMN